jgi:hypothetical protein
MKGRKVISSYRNAFLIFLLLVPSVQAAERIVVLNYELKDLTLVPGTEAELARTDSIAPLLRNELEKTYGYQIVPIVSQVQNEADVAVGYLFDHSDVAAELCKVHGADWITVGRLHKPSFLFAYIKAHLINCNSKNLVGNYTIEVKGAGKDLTAKGVAKLAIEIDQTIQSI